MIAASPLGNGSWGSTTPRRHRAIMGGVRRVRSWPEGRRAVAQFAISGLVAVAVIAVLGMAALRQIGRQEAIRDARELTRVAGVGVVQPSVSQGVLRGDPRALARLDRLVRRRLLRGPVVRIKLWTPSGRIVFSDERRLVGSRYPLGEEELAALRAGRTEAEVSDLSRPENRFERGYEKLLEVYLPIRGPHGQRLLFESYQRFASVTASGRRILAAFAPALLGGLLLLQLINLPLAGSLARRIRRGREERERLLRHAVAASDVERRKVAADLHDGVVQDVAGLSLSLAAEAGRAEARGDGEGSRRLADAARTSREATRTLRNLLVDLHPPGLGRAGLAQALEDVLAGMRSRGVEVQTSLPERVALAPDIEALLFRISQEAVRNVARHAQASRVVVDLALEDGHAVLEVRDDGRGFVPDARGRPPAGEGHIGLQMLGDLVADSGGRLEVRSAAGAGTTVHAEVPLA